MNEIFRDRVEAGQQLAGRLEAYAERDDVIVLALPRGGVPVGFEVACRLHAPLDVLVVRKLGVPGCEELAMGAIGPDGIEVRDAGIIAEFHVTPAQFAEVVRRERAELERRLRRYRDDLPFPELTDRIVLLVDDGIATGSTMRAAVRAVKAKGARSIVVAAPIAVAESAAAISRDADELIAVLLPEQIHGIGQFYGDFQPTTDEEVKALLVRAAVRLGSAARTPVRPRR